jgi:hypothetical protein
MPVIRIVSDFSGWRGYAAGIMRTLAIIAAALMIALSPPALAKSDRSPSPPPGPSAKADKPEKPSKSEPDKPGKPEKPEKPAKPEKLDKPEPPGETTGSITPPGRTPSTGPSGQTTDMELDEAQRAVQEHEALPLARIIAVAESRTTGHVINAKLLRIDGSLLYQLTLLDDTGLSWREYYLARTGNPVIIR